MERIESIGSVKMLRFPIFQMLKSWFPLHKKFIPSADAALPKLHEYDACIAQSSSDAASLWQFPFSFFHASLFRNWAVLEVGSGQNLSGWVEFGSKHFRLGQVKLLKNSKMLGRVELKHSKVKSSLKWAQKLWMLLGRGFKISIFLAVFDKNIIFCER